MFDIGWSELVVIAVVALIAIGPKELPGVLRMVGQWMGKARKMAAEFQGQFNEAMREAEMADVKKSFDDIKEAASGFTTGNLMNSLTRDVSDAMAIDKVATVDTPTTPEPPAPETLVAAETYVQQHAEQNSVVGEPLAITREVTPAPVAPQATAVNDTPATPVAAQSTAVNESPATPGQGHPDVLKDAKAS